jgi:hypothetical protein
MRTVIILGSIIISNSIMQLAELPDSVGISEHVLKCIAWVVSISIVMDIIEFFSNLYNK